MLTRRLHSDKFIVTEMKSMSAWRFFVSSNLLCGSFLFMLLWWYLATKLFYALCFCSLHLNWVSVSEPHTYDFKVALITYNNNYI